MEAATLDEALQFSPFVRLRARSPISIEPVNILNAPPGQIVMAVAYGDQRTYLIESF